jgi:TM2 domain-containing membrane protein YozV
MKSRGAAAVMALFLGTFGLHKFYLGRPGAGLAYLFFSWSGIPTLLSLFDTVHLAVMSEQEFHLRYSRGLYGSAYPQLPPGYAGGGWQGQPQGWQGQPQGWQGQPQGWQGQPQGWQGQPQGWQGQPQGWQGQPQGWQGQPQGGYGAAPHASPPSSSGPSPSVAQELERLHELRISGALTEEEYQAHKQRLLGPR